ncbi:MAG: gluconate 2-dehydrogenase subunit 3 family protein [Halioglobus sp.]
MDYSLHIQTDKPLHDKPRHKAISRRDTLKWLGVVSVGLSVPLISGCESLLVSAAKIAGHWPDLKLEPIAGEGYGTDPDLASPPKTPWPLTMTAEQRKIATVLVDIIIPREGDKAAASEVNVVDLLNEWVSAPYPSYQADRIEILSGLAWLDEESVRRFSQGFVDVSTQQQLQIIDDIAYDKAKSELRYAYMANVFDGIRTLVVIAYFGSPQGSEELGYQGNVAISGDYPGPTQEAIVHLDGVLQELGLSEYAYSS